MVSRVFHSGPSAGVLVPLIPANDLAYSERARVLTLLVPSRPGPVLLCMFWWFVLSRGWTGWNPSCAVVRWVSSLLSASRWKLVLYMRPESFAPSMVSLPGALVTETPMHQDTVHVSYLQCMHFLLIKFRTEASCPTSSYKTCPTSSYYTSPTFSFKTHQLGAH